MLYQFKDTDFSRGYRLQNIEDNFGKGMQWTNTPLLEGYNKILVNYDIYEAGASLKPRQGLRAYKGFHKAEAVNTYAEDTAIRLDYAHFYADQLKTLFIAHDTLLDPEAKLAPIKAFTGGGAPGVSDPYSVLTESEALIDAPHAVTPEATDEFGAAYLTYYMPKNAKIHDISVESTNNMARIAGCLGFNENYYGLGRDAATAGNACIWHTEHNGTGFVWKKDPAKELTAKEAVTYGYNMLSSTPYTFVNQAAAEGAHIEFQGMLPYDAQDKLCMTPILNQTYTFKCFAKVPAKKYHFIVKWRTASDTVWETLRDWTEDVTYQSAIEFQFSPPYDAVIIQITATGFTETVEDTMIESALAVGFSFKKEDYGSTANVDNKTYTVADGKGVCYWKNRLVVWGVPEDEKILFVSDINNPTYFPYPNNIDIFDSAIRYCTAFQNYLLVFTANALYSLRLDDTGTAWTTSCIQKNLYIDDWDTHLIQVVKNMAFFKSGNYYFMVVPKASSTTGELTIAAISKPLVYFFDNFETNVAQLFKDVYNFEDNMPLTLVHYYNYLDYEDVHNVYVFKKYHTGTVDGVTQWIEDSEYVNLAALYSTVDRSWRMYLYGSPAVYVPFISDATQKGALCTCICSKLTAEATVYEPFFYALRYNADNCADLYVPKGSITDWTVNFVDQNTARNYQLLDTGYREHTSNFKKRYRELQFTLNNTSQVDLDFYTDFYIDGAPRKQTAQYDVVVNTDVSDDNYGLLSVERTLVDPASVPGAIRLNEWRLDHSVFSGIPMWKVRFPVSGKGYVPRMVIKCMSQMSYELLNLSWVYRALYSR